MNTRMLATLIAIGTITLSSIAPTVVSAEASAVEPDATRILKRMTDYVGGLKRFSLDTENMLDEVLVSGQKIQYDFTTSVTVQ